VYRAIGGEEPDGGSWTLSLPVAIDFAETIGSRRGTILGYEPTSPAVCSGEVNVDRVLGHFISRGEHEVLLPMGAVSNVQRIAQG